jgi:hypothetical protein
VVFLGGWPSTSWRLVWRLCGNVKLQSQDRQMRMWEEELWRPQFESLFNHSPAVCPEHPWVCWKIDTQRERGRDREREMYKSSCSITLHVCLTYYFTQREQMSKIYCCWYCCNYYQPYLGKDLCSGPTRPESRSLLSSLGSSQEWWRQDSSGRYRICLSLITEDTRIHPNSCSQQQKEPHFYRVENVDLKTQNLIISNSQTLCQNSPGENYTPG